MNKWTVTLIITCFAFFTSIPCRAEKAYVTNPSKITLRGGPGTDQKILAMVSQGEPVEILDSQEGWKHVRLLGPKWNDKEGWIVSGFLRSSPPLEVQAGMLAETNASLKGKLSKLETEWQSLTGERDTLKGKLEETERALLEVKESYKTLKKESTGILKLKEARETAQKAMQEALEKAEALTTENIELKSSQRNTWFLTGGTVMLVGVIFGLALGKREKRRKSSYY